MKTVEIIGYKRANLGKTESKRLRLEGYVPGVLYGGEKQIHFYAPTILFRDAVYTSDAHFVELNIEGDIHRAILQDIQFHPVSETIMHADFLEIFAGKENLRVLLTGSMMGITSELYSGEPKIGPYPLTVGFRLSVVIRSCRY